MLANERTVQEEAENWDLPIEAIEEIIRYCEANQDVIGEEADEEKRFLLANGVELEPRNAA